MLVSVLLATALLVGAPQSEPVIEVIELTGYVDDASLAYLRNSINAAAGAARELAIVQLDAEAIVGSPESVTATAALIADPPLPLVVWVGPAPAVADGGLEQLAIAAPLSVTADSAPTIRQLVQDLDGVSLREGDPPLSTITAELPAGQVGVTTVPVIFTQPGLWHRFLHLGASPEAAFFFLVAGLTLAAFEYFALGPGLASGVAALSLLLASYGLGVIPIRPLALAGAILSILLFAVGHQRGGVLAIAVLATAALTWSGFNFSADPDLVPIGAVGVVFAALTVLFFFLLAIPAVSRARMSTQTIGRETLLGQRGTARVDFSPDGSVMVNGAEWPATAHREASIRAGDPVVVTAVAGRELEVERQIREN
ncbi:MAG: NfeD family protein [Acidimicrobiia bacterium]